MAEAERNYSRLIKAAVTLLVIVVVAILYWYFYINPTLQDIDQARAEQEKLNRDIEVLNRKLAQEEDVKQEWLALQEDRERMELLIPSLEKLSHVMGNLEQLLDEVPVTVNTLRAMEIKIEGQHALIAMDLNVTGSDGNLITLLAELEGFLHRVVIDSITWNREPAESNLTLRLRLVLVPEG